MKVVITGGRDFNDRELLYGALDYLMLECGLDHIAAGGCSGADELAAEWALQTGVSCTTYPADWETHGRAAGPIRNQHMLKAERPDHLVAFDGGRGTANCCFEARKLDIPVWVVRPGWQELI